MKNYRIPGHLFFAVLFGFACYFCLERILYADSAFYLYKIINFEKLNPENHRYAAVITQFLPLLSIKLGLPLKYVIPVYSVSFILIYYIVFLICVYLLKNETAGLVIVLVLVLGIQESFFHPVTETHQAVVYVMLFYAWITFPLKIRKRPLKEAIFFLTASGIIVLCYFTHPVSFFLILFIIGYRMVSDRQWADHKLYILIFLTLLVFSVKFFTTSDQSYEGQYFASIRNATEIITGFFRLYPVIWFYRRIADMYWLSLVLTVIVTILYIRRKAYLDMAYYLFAICGYFVINVITYYQGDSAMAMERSFMPMSVLICIPFVREVILLNGKKKLLKHSFLMFILLYNLVLIFRTGHVLFRERRAYLDSLFAYTSRYTERKFVIEKKNVNMDKIMVPWAIGAETLLYSCLHSPDDARTIYMVDNLEDFHFDDSNPDLYLCVSFWRNWDAGSLNRSYFNLPPGKYRVLKEKIPD